MLDAPLAKLRAGYAADPAFAGVAVQSYAGWTAMPADRPAADG